MAETNTFVKVAKSSSVKENEPCCASANGKALALFRSGGKLYALDNACTHARGPLCQGSVDGGAVVCPLHGSKFDIKTGKVLGGPATKPVQTYEARESGGDVEVKV